MERHDEQSRAHPEPEPTESRRRDPLESPAPTGEMGMEERTPEERAAADQTAYVDREAAPQEDSAARAAATTVTSREPGTYETTTTSDDRAATQRDDYSTQRGDDFAAQAPSAPPSGPQQDVSTEEAAERKAVQPRTADASSPETAAAATTTATGQAPSDQPGVLSREDAQGFQVRWEAIQAVFVDDPQAATEQADALVGEVMDQLLRLRQEYLTQLRGALGEGADTEAMRVALRRYRAFFNVLLGP
jgi:hypothetical protein